MPAKPRDRAPVSQLDPLRFLLTLMLSVGALYAGRPVLLPLALSILIAFILTPLVVGVQRWRIGRVPAVLLVMGFSLLVAVGVGYGVGVQVSKLADQMPDYITRINSKINSLQTHGAGPFSRALQAMEEVGQSAEKAKPDRPAEHVVVTQVPQSTALEKVSAYVSPVLEPVADAALIFVLVAFMLICREDLRNRVIGLLGHGRLTGTTRMFVTSAERISKLLLMQLCVNIVFGLVFGLALLLLGLRYWFLWGFLVVVLRFVPFIGSWVAALLPVLLSFAVSPGWSQPLLILAVFVAIEAVTANVIEPLIFGHSTGVTPVALLVAAVFWAWIWGTVGLVLSTPLTVCLVVMGQNIPSLRFLSLLMGERAALEPHAAYYQRLLAGDRNEALLIAREFGKSQGWDQLPDGVVLPALKLARRDRENAGLTVEDETFILNATQGVVEVMPSESNANQSERKALVLGCAAHHRVEELTIELLSRVLPAECRMASVSTRTLPSEIEARVQREQPAIVFIAIVPPGGLSQARYLCRRLRRKFPDLKIVVGYFGTVRDFDALLTKLRAAGASYVSTSVLQSRNQIQALLQALPAEQMKPML